MRTLAGQVRQYFYKITLPWTDEGYRLLPANLYFDLTARMREFEASFEQGVEAFLAIYPQYIEQVRPELNGLFREEDYPKAEKLRRKFGVKLEVLPIPTGNDFRVQIDVYKRQGLRRWKNAEIDRNADPAGGRCRCRMRTCGSGCLSITASQRRHQPEFV